MKKGRRQSWSVAPDCKSGGLIALVGSNPSLPTLTGGCCNGSDSHLHCDRIGSIPIPPTTFGVVV